MANSFKDKILVQGMKLMQSPTVEKIMANEKVGIAIQKAMEVPLKVSGAMMSQKERLVAMFDLATQNDVDQVRMALSRVESVLKEIKEESGELLRKMNDDTQK